MRFTIRDLLWLTVVVALVLAWWMDRRNIQHERDVWKYHVKGAEWLSSAGGAKNIVVNGDEMTGKLPTGSFTRQWPDEGWWYDGPKKPKLPGSSASAPNPPKK